LRKHGMASSPNATAKKTKAAVIPATSLQWPGGAAQQGAHGAWGVAPPVGAGALQRGQDSQKWDRMGTVSSEREEPLHTQSQRALGCAYRAVRRESLLSTHSSTCTGASPAIRSA
jgi:hypothetical protein